jgi:hypothetical protein
VCSARDRFRRPYRQANKLPYQVERTIVWPKKEHPSWSAPKIRDKLTRSFPVIKAPSTSTIHALLDRRGLVKRCRRRRSKAPIRRERGLKSCKLCSEVKSIDDLHRPDQTPCKSLSNSRRRTGRSSIVGAALHGYFPVVSDVDPLDLLNESSGTGEELNDADDFEDAFESGARSETYRRLPLIAPLRWAWGGLDRR